MFVIIWRYQVAQGSETDFTAAYGSRGSWVQLFERGDGYLGTELVVALDRGRYLTIDRWESSEAFDAFIANHKESYQALDVACEGLTIEEQLVGRGLVASE